MAERDLNSVILPRLDDAQMAALGRCAGATLKHYRASDKLIEVGEFTGDVAHLTGGPSLVSRRLRRRRRRDGRRIRAPVFGGDVRGRHRACRLAALRELTNVFS